LLSRVRPASVLLADESATLEYGRGLARSLEPGDLVFLSGDLGAGKTTLVRGILRGFGHLGSVKSPTYTLLEPYQLSPQSPSQPPPQPSPQLGGLTVYHFDFYRIGDPRELEFIGIDELMDSDAVKLVEWPERGAQRLPSADVLITMKVENEGRRIEISVSR
jgi:tRNA threonylcarbamoyladenosine biosynthesis protein TsaE